MSEDQKILERILEHTSALTKGPLYSEAKRIAEKMMKVMPEDEHPGKMVSNGQLILIGAMISASMISRAPDGEVEKVAIQMHEILLNALLTKMRQKELH